MRALKERAGAFSIYSPEEEVELVGYSSCGGCPGGNIEYVPEEMINNKAEVIHLATGLVVATLLVRISKHLKPLLNQSIT